MGDTIRRQLVGKGGTVVLVLRFYGYLHERVELGTGIVIVGILKSSVYFVSSLASSKGVISTKQRHPSKFDHKERASRHSNISGNAFGEVRDEYVAMCQAVQECYVIL